MQRAYLLYYAFLFLLTFLGGLVPIIRPQWSQKYLNLFLTLTASFLLGITFVHLIPDAFQEIGTVAGILVLAGFFGQQIVQRYTHGIEHGHHQPAEVKQGGHVAQSMTRAIFIGLAIHAFSEGLPLAITYPDAKTLPSLILAIGLHKIPEIILVVAMALSAGYSKKIALLLLFLFALITPAVALMARILGQDFNEIALILKWSIPFVAGVFIQISTTIFYESSTKTHVFKGRMWLMVIIGIGLALLSLI